MSLHTGSLRAKNKVIITGATGMVGEGVLHECLNNPKIEQVLVINRKPCGVTHPKLTEILHPNFADLREIEDQLGGYDACFFCLGVSSVGMTEEKYKHLTYDLTLHAAVILVRHNPEMVFCYVTAQGTDSTEQGRSMWARVKGKTENDLLKLPFKKAYMFRPGFIRPTPGLTRTHKYYAYINWMYPALRPLFPQYMISLQEIGLAMINSISKGPERAILGCKEIAALAAVK